jgi:transcriptional regulator with XRE-family HTH domain
LRNWRGRKGITQAQAAEIFGISVRTFQGLEQALGRPSQVALNLMMPILTDEE